jgi:hypothetical protein
MCSVCVLSHNRESPDMILGEKPLIWGGGDCITFGMAAELIGQVRGLNPGHVTG